jgi:glycosyltransferase involved in cell wall biosynthesis
MRVAMICNYPVDPKVVPGGVTAVAHYLVKGLGRVSGLDLHVVCCQADVESERTEERDGATIHFLHDPDRFSLLLRWWPQRRAIARVMRRIRPELAHAQGLGLTAAAAIDSGLPFAVSLHGILWKEANIHHPSRRKHLRGKLRARAALGQLERTRNVFITSGYAARMLPPGRTYRQFIVNNPVGEEIFAIRNEPTAPHVLVVGGLRHRKDPRTALRVMERVLAEVPDATMHLLGPPSGTPLDREMAELAGSGRLKDRVKLLGLVPDESLWEEYAKASLLLLTSLEETAPVALGEALAVGLPAVVTDAGGNPYLIQDGETGFVRPVGDVEALAERVIELLRDGELRARLATHAREVGRRHFALDAIAAQTVAAYEEILGN